MEKDILHINKELYIKWSKQCWEAGKDGTSFEVLEKEMKKMFKDIKEENSAQYVGKLKMEKEIFKDIKEKVKKTREEDKILSELSDKMEKSLTLKEKKEFEEINFNREHNLQASLFDFGFVQGYKFLEENILELIDEDMAYQRSKLTGNFETDKPIDKPIKWRIVGFEDLKKKLMEDKR